MKGELIEEFSSQCLAQKRHYSYKIHEAKVEYAHLEMMTLMSVGEGDNLGFLTLLALVQVTWIVGDSGFIFVVFVTI